MAFIGMKHPVFAPITSMPAGSLPTYGTGFVVGLALEAKVDITMASSKLYGDDAIAESDKSFQSGKITLGIDDLSKDVIVDWLGSTDVTVGGVPAIRDAGNNASPEGGFGYYRVRKKGGVRSIRAYWYYRTQWGQPSESSKTKGENIEWQTLSLEGDVMAVPDTDNTWRDIADFDTEAAAAAWLDGLANTGTPADLTDLNAAIAAAELLDSETYTSASWVGLANALDAAQAVAAMDNPSQTQVDAAEDALDDATGDLVERGV